MQDTTVSIGNEKNKLSIDCNFEKNNMGDADFSKYDLARLQDELEQEREMKEMLQESVCDLRSTMTELEERLNSVNLEGNEWKTRYDTQVELNGQLERQITLVHERLEDLQRNPMDRLASIRSYDEIPVDALRQRLKVLTNEKAALQGQLLDCGLRIEQEGKAFHKANSERRAYLSEIAKLSSNLDVTRRKYQVQPQRAPESQQYPVQPHRAPESHMRKGKQTSKQSGREEGRGGGRGGGGGGTTTEEGRGGGGRGVRKAELGSRLPRLKH
ncbi:coiled-coil domain containing 169 [Coregonus clupeaformis]|uniref:coiled-coil domain containing 169 n=1 Tax=Coregonus clupeaformis TaxID=59861 RepID=UPI001E1C3D3B|nr:coiled-coil domain containing 169 [Coregonus clupeaformis]